MRHIPAAGQAVGLVEGGQLFVVRTDHIGPPVLATSDAGAVVGLRNVAFLR